MDKFNRCLDGIESILGNKASHILVGTLICVGYCIRTANKHGDLLGRLDPERIKVKL